MAEDELDIEIPDTPEGAEPEQAEQTEDTNSVEEQLAERTEDLQRVTAEYANFRRRTERDRAATIEQAKGAVLKELLPILDDLALAADHGDLEGPLKSVSDKLNQTLTHFGVEAFGTPGDIFDPERHEAVQDQSTGDDKVLGLVMRKGYAHGERILRTAMVMISDPEN
ncbi:nucleotide exchange factor GrpE [Corynebacterium sp. 13CS0277]|nr:nucleotide exchange factor GrpE [Corynebacterium sp. 13CS0277]PRQ11820.1 nucleotide exchange factor GrpE [Corynebacterium sp. 13CS0277]